MPSRADHCGRLPQKRGSLLLRCSSVLVFGRLHGQTGLTVLTVCLKTRCLVQLANRSMPSVADHCGRLRITKLVSSVRFRLFRRIPQNGPLIEVVAIAGRFPITMEAVET